MREFARFHLVTRTSLGLSALIFICNFSFDYVWMKDELHIVYLFYIFFISWDVFEVMHKEDYSWALMPIWNIFRFLLHKEWFLALFHSCFSSISQHFNWYFIDGWQCLLHFYWAGILKCTRWFVIATSNNWSLINKSVYVETYQERVLSWASKPVYLNVTSPLKFIDCLSS